MTAEDYLHILLGEDMRSTHGTGRELDDFEMFQLRHSERYRTIESESGKSMARRLVDLSLNMGLTMTEAIDEIPEGELTRQAYLQAIVTLSIRARREVEGFPLFEPSFSDAISAIADIGWHIVATGQEILPVA